MDHTECSHCRAPLPAPRSRLLGGLVLGLAYVVTFAFAFGYACLGPLGLMILPFFLPGAIGAITCAHTYASSGECCPACGKLIELQPKSVVPRPGTLVAQT
jgi:hypothetical protein